MCHPIGQFHKTGMDELGYRRVFYVFRWNEVPSITMYGIQLSGQLRMNMVNVL